VRGEETRLTVAGRTDAGVHARAQVASHPGSPAPLARLNAMLPHDIRALISEEVHPDFDARRDALSRTYRYRVLTRRIASPFERTYALHVYGALDVRALEACAAALEGTHDFTAFTPSDTRHTRFERTVLRAEWVREPEDILTFWIEADTFMRHMVRILVGTMLATARGRNDVAHFEALLKGQPRREAAETAPPHGLFLESVRYLD
jgi:tRNA pseudouridine38-40 synthase